MKGWKTALALGAAAAAAGAVAGEYFYRFALTQQIDKTAAFNAPHNRPTGAPRGTLTADREWLNAQPHEDWWLTSGDGLQLHALCVRAGGNAPWAVLCHGYTGQASGMAEYARRFYDAGFSLLLPDARGHGQSEGGYIGMGWPERRDTAAQRAGYRGGLRLYHRMGGVPLSAEKDLWPAAVSRAVHGRRAAAPPGGLFFAGGQRCGTGGALSHADAVHPRREGCLRSLCHAG